MSDARSAPPPDPAQLLSQLLFGYAASAALFVAAKLGVADHLAAGPRAVEDLARATGAHEDALYRVLRLLASLGVFAQEGRSFALAPAGALLRRDDPQSMHAVVLFATDPLHFRVYANLIDAVRTGRPTVEQTVGQPLFDYLPTDPAYAEIFNASMTAFSKPVIHAVLEAYDFNRFEVIVDVGGGHGEVLRSILKACPGVRGILAEVPHVAAGARGHVAEDGLAHRCQVVDCDFFREVPTGGDAYLMKHVLHDWDDARAEVILRNIAAAMGDRGGTLLLLESVLPEGAEPDTGKFLDLEMLLMTGGRERTRGEWESLLARSGFELRQVHPTKSPAALIEAARA